MTSYTVQLEQMSFVEGEMQAIAKKIQATLEELDANVRKSLAHWDSDSKQAYYEQQQKWNAAAAAMQHQAEKTAQSLNTIGQNYNDGEKYGVSLWEG